MKISKFFFTLYLLLLIKITKVTEEKYRKIIRFISCYYMKLNMQLIFENLPEEIYNFCYKNYKYSFWFAISECQLSKEFIIKHKNNIHWTPLLGNNKVSEGLIEEFYHHIDEYPFNWYRLSETQNLSEDFIKKHENRIEIDLLFKRNVKSCSNLSFDFILKNRSKIHDINMFPQLSEDDRNFIKNLCEVEK